MDQFELFQCTARACRLTRKGCASIWTRAQEKRPEPWEGSWHCRDCSIGAANAGKAPEPQVDDALERLCPRCGRLTDRMIKGRLCISCYNREGEVRRGRNRKGHYPVRVADSIRTIIAIFTVNGVEDIREFESVTSVNEVYMTLLREFGRGAVIKISLTDAEETIYAPWIGADSFVLGKSGVGLEPARPRAVTTALVRSLPTVRRSACSGQSLRDRQVPTPYAHLLAES